MWGPFPGQQLGPITCHGSGTGVPVPLTGPTQTYVHGQTQVSLCLVARLCLSVCLGHTCLCCQPHPTGGLTGREGHDPKALRLEASGWVCWPRCRFSVQLAVPTHRPPRKKPTS